jgi:hypothetical protein
MLFFRSEEDLEKWLVSRKAACGAILSIQVQEIFKEVGLTSPFWQI